MPATYHINIDSYIGYPISKGYIRSKLQGQEGNPVAVRINSYGGDVQHALDIRQQFLDHGQVTAYIFGMTASAATILATGAKKIVMSRYALMLIHPCSQWVDKWGTFNADELAAEIEKLKGTAADLANIDHVIAAIYAARTGATEKAMAETMKAARWLTADECLELGLVDELLEPADEEGESQSQLTAAAREHFVACGLPLPAEPKPAPAAEKENAETLIGKLLNLFRAGPTDRGHDTAGESQAVTTPNSDKVVNAPTEGARADRGSGAETEHTPVTDEPNTETEMNNQTEPKKISADRLLKVTGLQTLEPTAEGAYRLTAEQLEAIEDRLAELETQVDNLGKADGDETHDVQPEAAEEETLPGVACANFYNKFKNLI